MDVFNFFTVSEREDYWTRNARELLVLNNLVADKYPDMADVAFDNLLFVYLLYVGLYFQEMKLYLHLILFL